jgi:hypothetical protein
MLDSALCQQGARWASGGNDVAHSIRPLDTARILQQNSQRFHESLNNLTPADLCFGCGQRMCSKNPAGTLRSLCLTDG